MVEALVLITDDASYHCQWIFSAVYALVIIHHGNMIFNRNTYWQSHSHIFVCSAAEQRGSKVKRVH